MNSHALLLFAPLALTLAGCGNAVTPAKLDKITPGLKAADVTAQLGQPTRIDHTEITGLTGDAYHYVSSQGDARVVFIDGTVYATQFVPGKS